MRVAYVILLLCWWYNPLWAQTVSARDFFVQPIGSALTVDGSLTQQNMPWIERYEARTETRDFDAGSQEFTLRLIPSTPGKRRAQTAYYLAIASAPTPTVSEAECEIITARYQDWLRLYAIQQEMDLLRELDKVNADRRIILNRRAGAQDLDLARVFSLTTRATDYQLRLNDLMSVRQRILDTYGMTADSLDFSGLVNPTQINPAAPAALPGDKSLELAHELDLVNKEMALERSEQRQYVDFVQFKYQGPQAQLLREKFSVGIGFQLQNRGSDRIKMRELELERQEIEREQGLVRAEREGVLTTFSMYFTHELENYHRTDSLYQTEEATLSTIYRNASISLPANLNLLLDISERRVRNRINLTRMRIDLLDEYLDFLKDSNQLCSRADGGWLTR